MKIEIKNEKFHKGRIKIDGVFSFSDCEKTSVALEEAKKFLPEITSNNEDYFVILQCLTKLARMNKNEISIDIHNILDKSSKMNKFELAYILKNVMKIDSGLPWGLNDIDLIYRINEKLSRELFMVVRWFERKIHRSIITLLDYKKMRLNNEFVNITNKKDGEQIKLLNAISNLYMMDLNTNEKILSSLPFGKKIMLWKFLDIENKLKINSLNLFSDYNIENEKDLDHVFTELINLFEKVHGIRNAISHNAFVLAKCFGNEIKGLIGLFFTHGKFISNNHFNHSLALMSSIIEVLESEDDNLREDKKRIIGISFSDLKNYIKNKRKQIPKKFRENFNTH